MTERASAGASKGKRKKIAGKKRKWTFGRGGKVKSPYVLVCSVLRGGNSSHFPSAFFPPFFGRPPDPAASKGYLVISQEFSCHLTFRFAPDVEKSLFNPNRQQARDLSSSASGCAYCFNLLASSSPPMPRREESVPLPQTDRTREREESGRNSTTFHTSTGTS